ncbi:serine hydrolase domain-containing protein [Nocardia stercoris]|uniref:Class A beta-lactamase-related serine hydrolase n=1 Tax=Nocardia stercoris TaxID=2483361 RepID=A0A3M2LA08_9NOCA|nr:serine hydrolase domain-containing protein [Nocardia stercoris]RMI31408.1 class A beta-lactamase-related serine hydrolase [Nocardia stercoris]
MGTRIATVVVGAGLLAAACGTSNPSHPRSEPAYATTLRPVLTEVMRDNVIPGAVVLVRSPKLGDWTESFGTGTLDRNDPIGVDDHFRIGSNTKTMTVTVILQLVQQGRLRLDDPVANYVPDVPGGDRITVAQLAEMRSGLYNYSDDLGLSTALDADPQRVWTPQQLLAIAFAHPVDFQPGERFEYSNTNTILLGLIIEKLTGESIADIFRAGIDEPLGLRHTSFPAPTDNSIPQPHPRGYAFGTYVSTIATIATFALPPDQQAAARAGTVKPADRTDDNPSWTWTAGAGISTVGDLATYVKALVGGGLLDAKTQQLRMDSVRPIDPAAPDNAGYGLGLVRFGKHLYGHDGQLPGYMTFMGYDPATDLTIVIATNLATVPSGEGSALTLLKAVLPVFYPGDAVPGGDPAVEPAPAPTR